MKKRFSFLKFIVIIPLLSTLLFLFSSVLIYSYFNIKDGEEKIKIIEKKLIENKKDIIENRVNFVLGCIKLRRKELLKRIEAKNYSKEMIQKMTKKTQDDILETINSLYFKGDSYVFVYKILNFNGGDRFAKMIANPNRKDLIGKYISDNYKDAKGFMFRKAFLEGIKKRGEVFVEYWYKKPSTDKISPKISYFKLDKEWSWVVASGEYLDEIYKSSKDRKQEILNNVKRNNKFLIFIAFLILVLSIFFSFVILKYTKREFTRYEEFTKRQRRALSVTNRMLKVQLYKDELTGLKNRKLLIQNLQKNDYYALVIIDIDEFKMINELYGNLLGNEVLIKLARYLEQYSRENFYFSTIYRLGSDEFVILVRRCCDVKKLKNKLNGLYKYILDKEFKLLENIIININITMGVTFKKRNSLSKADIALNYAKKFDKVVVFYSRAIDNRLDIDKNIQLKHMLLEAVQEDRIVPYFQPICDKNFNILKYEALIRMITKDNDVLTPDKFLDISKRLKLYPKLSRIVIEKSFETFKDKDFLFSINLSLNDIVNQEIVSFIKNKIKENPKVAKRVVFEILESEGIEDFDIVRKFINDIKKLGVKIAIDDFGSGYSSFRYILEIKPDFIKIDGSLIKDILTYKDSYVTVKNIVTMAKDLDVTTVAEFVSSKEIYETLKKLGVDEFQGFYIGKPSSEWIVSSN